MLLSADHKKIIVEKKEPGYEWLEFFFSDNKTNHLIEQTNTRLIISSDLLDAIIVYIFEHHDGKTNTNIILARLLLVKLTLISTNANSMVELKELHEQVSEITSIISDLDQMTHADYTMLDNIEHEPQHNSQTKLSPPLNSNPIKYTPAKAEELLTHVLTQLREVNTKFGSILDAELNANFPTRKRPSNSMSQTTLFHNNSNSADEKTRLLQAVPSAASEKFIIAFNARSKIISIKVNDPKLFNQLTECLYSKVQYIEGNNTISLPYPELQKLNLGKILTANLAELIPAIQHAVCLFSPIDGNHLKEPEEEVSSSCCCFF